ncbi:hypothetical protein ACIA8O_09635 [Kitasatospora sp. NPDC051853]|uniref:hypothetical protein n=1 Tax=Kitasatospora sp. NPDC051853 TaxID=3364058 RepID=UPI0037B23FFD
MSRIHRFVRKSVLPLVIGAAALFGAYSAAGADAAGTSPSAAKVAITQAADDISWT